MSELRSLPARLRRVVPTPVKRVLRARPGRQNDDARTPDPDVYVGVASIPSRADSLKTVVQSLVGQADRVGVYLNGYSEVPAFLRHPRIDVARSQDHGDTRDNGKFFFLKKTTHRLYAAVDDDIRYPPDYIDRLKKSLSVVPDGSAVGVHGAIYPAPVLGLLTPRNSIHFSQSSPHVLPVHVLGTGTLLFDQSVWHLGYQEFGTPGMADVWFARAAIARGASMFIINRNRAWLSAITDDEPSEVGVPDALFDEARLDDSLQVKLLNERGVSAGGLDRLVMTLIEGDRLTEDFTLTTAITLNSIRRKMGWLPLDPSTARRLDERLREVRGPWSGQAVLDGHDPHSHSAAIVGILSQDVTAATAQTVLALLDHCANVSERETDRGRSLPRALRMDSRSDRLQRIRSTVLALGMHRSAGDARSLWPIPEAPPLLALEAERAGISTGFESRPDLELIAGKNPLNSARLLEEYLDVRQWSAVPDVTEWRRIFGASFYRREVQTLLALAMSRSGERDMACRVAEGLRHRWPADVETRLAGAVVELASAGAYDRFSGCTAILDNLVEDVGLRPYRHYLRAEVSATGHWMDLLSEQAPQAPSAANPPTVSVIMTVYNSVEMVRQAISSVLMSEGVAVELIVIDDASTDGTADVVAGIDDDRIRLLVNEVNVGPYVSRNRGLRRATGDYVTFADADDWSHPQRLVYQVDRLEDDRDLVGCTVAHVRFQPDGLADLENHVAFLGHGPVTLLMRRQVVEELGGFDFVRTRGDIEYIGRIRARFGDDALAAFGAPLVLATASQSSNSKRFTADALQRYRDGARRWHQRANRESELFLSAEGLDRAPFIAPEELAVPRESLARLYNPGHPA